MHTFCVFMRKKCDICRSALRILVQNFLELGKKAVFADGVDLEKDVLGQMDFAPIVDRDENGNVKLMDARIFTDAVMGMEIH